MDAIIGKYRMHMEETGLILRHVSGISFDLTAEESLGLLDFLSAYRQTLQTLREDMETEPQLERINLDKDQD
ncbi:MAG TPA: hypothetical protein VF043_19655 [Ktedonobacteraceae bacterium]